MAEEESFKLNIPVEAIRTMKKDLAGITHGQWNLILEENEMSALLAKYKQRLAEQSNKQEKTKEEKIEEEVIIEKIRQAAKEKEKQEKSAEEDNHKIEDKKEKEEMTEEEKANEEELKTAAEIRRRALEREKLVREKLDKGKDSEMLAMEERHAQEEKERREKDLQIRIEELRQSLKELAMQKIPLDESKKYYLDQKIKIEKDLEPIIESERKIEDNIKFIGNIEKTAITPRQRKKAEQERQLAGKEREAIESQRWDYEQKKRKIEKQIQEIDFGYQQLAQQEEKTKQEIKDTEKELGKIDKEKEKIGIEHRITHLMKEKIEYSRLKKTIVGDRKEIEEKLAEIITQEEKVEKEVSYTQEEEKLSEGNEKERVEKERAKLGAIRSALEKRRWKIEEEKQKIRLEENRINIKHDKILEIENQLRKRIQEINSLLGIETPIKLKEQEPKEKSTKNVEREEETKIEEQDENIEQENIKHEQTEKKGSVGLQAKKIGEIRPKTIGAPEETKPVLEKGKKSEAKKALAQLEQKKRRQALLKRLRAKRIQGVEQKEKNILERIRKGVSPGSGATHEADNANVQTPKNQPKTASKPESAIRPPMMTIGPEDMGKKPWVRLAIIISAVILIIAVIGFWYWYTNVRGDEENPTPSPTPSPTPPVATTTPTSTPAIIRPTALIPTESVIPKEITHIDQAQAFISELFNNQTLTENEFARLLIKNSTEYLGLNKILPQLYLSPPPTLYSLVKDDATFYIYRRNNGQEKYNVFGFTAKISTSSDVLAGENITNEWSDLLAELMAGNEISEEDLLALENYALTSESLQNTMSEWENNLLTQAKYLAGSFGKQNIAETAIFNQELYGGYNLRYISLVEYPDCFGICYTITEDKLHVATCCKPIVELIKTNNQ